MLDSGWLYKIWNPHKNDVLNNCKLKGEGKETEEGGKQRRMNMGTKKMWS